MVQALSGFKVYVEEDLNYGHRSPLNWTMKDAISTEVDKYFGDQMTKVEELWRTALDMPGDVTLGMICEFLFA